MNTGYSLNVVLTIGISSDESPGSTADAVGQYVDEALHRISSGGFGSHHNVSHKIEHSTIVGSRSLSEDENAGTAPTVEGRFIVATWSDGTTSRLGPFPTDDARLMAARRARLHTGEDATLLKLDVLAEDVRIESFGPEIDDDLIGPCHLIRSGDGKTWCGKATHEIPAGDRHSRYSPDVTCSTCIDAYREWAS